jgi:transcriptional regulator with XRE-family HTH domain
MKFSKGLRSRLQKPSYRRSFVAATVGVQIAAQLYALRTNREKSQEKLAEEIGINQSTISQMEKPEYRKYNIKTLIRYAQYYDVALDVRFVSIRDHVKRILNQTPDSMAPAAFDKNVSSASLEPELQQLMIAFKKSGEGQPSVNSGFQHRDIKMGNWLLAPTIGKESDDKQFSPPVPV